MPAPKPPSDFLALCKRAGRDPATVKDPQSYMRGAYSVGEHSDGVSG